MENQNYTLSISFEELREIGIVNIPEFFHISKLVLTNAIASLAVMNENHIQGEGDRDTQITHLQQLQIFIRLLEQKELNSSMGEYWLKKISIF